jgi:glycosyltransferase involved in cell wall biosynthesis
MTATPGGPPSETDRKDADLPDVCVVTHPLAAAGENATRSLLDILAAITGIVLVTADLPADSSIRTDREVIEITSKGAGESVPVAAVRFLLNQLGMARVVWTREEEVVLFFGATAYLLPIVLARLAGKTVLIEPRGDVPLTLRLNWERRMPSPLAHTLAGVVRALERAGVAVANGVVTYTPSMARQFGLDPEAPAVFPDGARYVDTERFDVVTPFGDRDPVVGFLGRLDEEKEIRTLARAVSRLPDDVTVRFVGDGDLREWLEAELRDEIAEGRVVLTGWVDHDAVPEELNRMRLLVLPSRPTEGLPTTILESLACGTPVYSTAVSGVPDVVRPGETGFHVESRSPAAIGDGIESILTREDLPAISAAGRDLIEAEYSFEAACGRYRTILRTVSG